MENKQIDGKTISVRQKVDVNRMYIPVANRCADMDI